MRIESKFTRTIISKLVKMVLQKKFGYDIDILLNELNATIIDGKAHVHLNIDAELNKDELTKIVRIIGINQMD